MTLYFMGATRLAQSQVISGAELRARIDKLGLTYTAAAPLFGLTLDGLRKQMGGLRPVSRQTAIILDLIEEVERLKSKLRQGELPLERQAGRDRRLAQSLYPSASRRR
jgi:hypothetical protein